MRRRFASELATALDALLFASPSHRTKQRVADDLAALPRHEQDTVLHWAQVIAQTHPELAWQVCARARAAFTRPEGLSCEEFTAWVKAILADRDAHGGAAGDGVKADSRLLNDLDGFLRYRADSDRVDFAALSRRLGLFVRALSAGSLSVQSATGGVWTDGERVNLPPSLTGADAERRYFALAALANLQWSSGGLSEAVESVLVGSGEPTSEVLDWFEHLESQRLHRLLARQLPGIADALPRHDLPPEISEWRAHEGGGSEGALANAKLARELAASGRRGPCASYLRVDFAAVRAGRERLAIEASAAGRKLPNLFHSADGQRERADQGGQSLDIAVGADQGGAAGSSASGSEEAPTPQLSKAPSPDEAHGSLQPAGEGRWQAVVGQAGDTEAAPPASAAALRYDEWDYRRQDYRKDWCHLYEVAGEAGELGWVGATTRKHARLIKQIRRRFEALRGEERWLRHQIEGSEIDLDAVVDALAEFRATGGRGEIESRLFCERQRLDRSLAVAFMVDMSGSTKGWVNDAEREALVMLCEAIETLGDAYAIFGFSGWTHRRCDLYRIKHFDEAYGAAVKARIAGIEARDYTRMGPPIRHITQALAKRPERHKLLITLSDGRPDDYGDEYRGRYGIEDTRRALQEARRTGVRSYCITVDRHAADYLPELYGSAHYSVLADPRSLPLRVAQVYRRLVS